MIQLNDPRWKDFDGGYRIPYDASIALKRMEAAESQNEIDEIFKELWNELHHQGDLGLASYFALPHLIRIAKEKKIVDYNIFGLIAVIETERHQNNPELPSEFEAEYLQAIKEGVPDLVKIIIQNNWDATLSATVLSSLAAIKGQIEMAKAILKMEDSDIVTEFLENF